MSKRSALLVLLAVLTGLFFLASGKTLPRAKAQISISIGAQRVPNIAVDKSDNLFLLMAVATQPESTHSPGSQIFFTESIDGGKDWNDAPFTRNLSNTPIHGIGALNPSVALTRNGPTRAYVVYDDDTYGLRQVSFIRSKKNTSFKKPRDLIFGGEGGFSPKVAVDASSAVNIVWGDTANFTKQVVFTRSTDLGITFNEQKIISDAGGGGFSPVITIDSAGGIDVAWEDTALAPATIMFSRSSDAGATFSTPIKVSTGTGDASEPVIAADAVGGMNIAWVDQSSGAGEMMIARSTDSGVTFTPPVSVTTTPGADIHEPAITTSGITTYIAYNDNTTNQVYLTRSQSNLLSFSRAVQVSSAVPSRGHAHSASIAADHQGVLHIVWIDSSILGNDEGLLFYANTTDGHSFSAATEVLAFLPPV
ncbi:MAG TPA: sialidase family protein [Blastocatellia bacterium]|nr:sialidase family protein [Blastocatellia bacterium]